MMVVLLKDMDMVKNNRGGSSVEDEDGCLTMSMLRRRTPSDAAVLVHDGWKTMLCWDLFRRLLVKIGHARGFEPFSVMLSMSRITSCLAALGSGEDKSSSLLRLTGDTNAFRLRMESYICNEQAPLPTAGYYSLIRCFGATAWRYLMTRAA